MMRGKLWWVVSGCLLLGLAHAGGGAAAVRKAAEATMLVTGHIQVNPDGSLKSYTIDQSEKLPAPVREVIARAASRWEFQLSGPANEVVNASMSVRVLAHSRPDGQFDLSIEGASFGDEGASKGFVVTYSHQLKPRYPGEAAVDGVSGTVYLLLQIGRDGTVIDQVAEQVNLDQYGNEAQMKHYRKVLATEALSATKQWTFNPPTAGEDVNAPYWVVRVAVEFDLNARSGSKSPDHGNWKLYVPGPRETAPWEGQTLLSSAPDAIPDGGLQSPGSGLRLKTSLSGS